MRRGMNLQVFAIVKACGFISSFSFLFADANCHHSQTMLLCRASANMKHAWSQVQGAVQNNMSAHSQSFQ